MIWRLKIKASKWRFGIIDFSHLLFLLVLLFFPSGSTHLKVFNQRFGGNFEYFKGVFCILLSCTSMLCDIIGCNQLWFYQTTVCYHLLRTNKMFFFLPIVIPRQLIQLIQPQVSVQFKYKLSKLTSKTTLQAPLQFKLSQHVKIKFYLTATR